MERLVENITSNYVQAANRFLPDSRNVRRVVAYVESYDDIAFWRLLLEEFESDTLRFHVMLPTSYVETDGTSELQRGKKSAIYNCLGRMSFGNNLIACVDSDYDYLLQNSTKTSSIVNNSPYIFQTYTYSIENYLCYSGCLHHICVQSTLNDRRIIDFVSFLESYSRVIYPLFLWSVWAYKYNKYRDFSLHTFNYIVKLPSFKVSNPESCLKRLGERIDANVKLLQSRFSDAAEQVEALEKEFESLGVLPQETYLYIQGHSLIDNVICKILDPVCTILRHEREQEISSQAIHSEQYDNEMRSYIHSQADVKDLIRKNTHYRVMPQYIRMRERLRRFVETLG